MAKSSFHQSSPSLHLLTKCSRRPCPHGRPLSPYKSSSSSSPSPYQFKLPSQAAAYAPPRQAFVVLPSCAQQLSLLVLLKFTGDVAVPPIMSAYWGSRVTATGLAFMLLAVSGGVRSGDPAAQLLGFVGVIIGANLVAVGVHMGEGPTTPITRAAYAGVDAITSFLRRNLAGVGLIMASSAVAAVAGGEAGPVLCCAMFAVLLLGLCFIGIRLLGE